MSSSRYADYFDLQSDAAVCLSCRKKISRKDGNTTGLSRHLKSKHADDYAVFSGAVNAVKKRKVDDKTPSIISCIRDWREDGAKTAAVNRAIALMVAVDSEPFCIVERRGFVNLLKILAPWYNVRSRTSVSRTDIPNLYEEYKKRIQDRLESAKFVSFTSDSWTSEDNRHSLLSVTAHWIGCEPEGTQNSRVLGVLPIEGRHTADNLSSLLSNCIAEFLGSERADRCHLIVRDAASVMKKTVRLSGLRSIDCFAHQLQLAVYSGLRKAVMIDFDGVLEKIKKFIRKLRKSGVERQEFIALQQLEEIPPRWLKKGIEVRWNSLHDMIERFLENKAVIDIFCMDKSSFPKIAPAEYLIMQKMVDSLQPIKKATVMLQGRNVTISSVIPTIFVLRRALNDCGTEVSTAILLNLEERVEGIEENADYVVATLLDPKFKADFIEEPQQVASRELLKTKAEKMLAVVLAETTVNSIEKEVERSRPEQNNNSADFFEKYRCSQMPIVVSSTPPIDERMKLALEIEEYFRTPADPAADAITFWSQMSSGTKFPVLKMVSEKYLSSPATSVESERLFSMATLALTDLRKSMNVDNLQKLLFLKYNVPLEGFQT
ncbi:hypothetical protein QR680_016066 [Steinernema hermaphroditum]|uniref:BED-type domain-containing protein n=1 Tax=Steinernema hermaphroditum TaxID=289476 RepID=A0AA39H9X8_9BILA|nr:hypothetical protein QR680_016066 [Steinernema hermaphroditum]